MRSIWKGSISFGLVNIPVQMYSASKEKEFSFVMLHKKDLSQIKYARICKLEDKEVPWSEIVKGYEVAKGDFVVLEDSDFEKADIKKSKTIEIIQFIGEDEIDSIYFVKPYFLEPDKNAGKTYSLLRDALKKSKKVGLAKYVIKNREHLAILKVFEDMLVLNEVRFQNELVIPQDLKIPPSSKQIVKEMDIAMQLVDQLTMPFDPTKYKDTYSDELRKIIKQKAKGKPIHPKSEAPSSTKVQDIMSLLKASLEKPKKTKSKSKTA
jgi:DNA end-binding protein Ku